MTSSDRDPLANLAGPAQQAFEMWISLWPVAPLFGVEWRFAEVATQTNRIALDGMTTAMQAVGSGVEQVEEQAEAFVAATAPADVAAAMADPDAFEPEEDDAPLETATPAAAESPAEATHPAPEPESAGREAGNGTTMAEAAPGAVVSEAPVAVPTEGPETDPARPDVAAAAPEGLFEARPDAVDDLQAIKGIGPGLEGQLNALGIYRLDQLAGLDEANLVWIDENLSAFKGRAFRDDWVGQAKGLIG